MNTEKTTVQIANALEDSATAASRELRTAAERIAQLEAENIKLRTNVARLHDSLPFAARDVLGAASTESTKEAASLVMAQLKDAIRDLNAERATVNRQAERINALASQAESAERKFSAMRGEISSLRAVRDVAWKVRDEAFAILGGPANESLIERAKRVRNELNSERSRFEATKIEAVFHDIYRCEHDVMRDTAKVIGKLVSVRPVTVEVKP